MAIPDWFLPLLASTVLMVIVVVAAPAVRAKIAESTIQRAVADSRNTQPNDLYSVLFEKITRLEKQLAEQEVRLRLQERHDAESEYKYAKLLAENEVLRTEILELKASVKTLYGVIDRSRGEAGDPTTPQGMQEYLDASEDSAFRVWLGERFLPGELVVLAADARLDAPGEGSASAMAAELLARARRLGAAGRLAALALERRPNVQRWSNQ